MAIVLMFLCDAIIFYSPIFTCLLTTEGQFVSFDYVLPGDVGSRTLNMESKNGRWLRQQRIFLCAQIVGTDREFLHATINEKLRITFLLVNGLTGIVL